MNKHKKINADNALPYILDVESDFEYLSHSGSDFEPDGNLSGAVSNLVSVVFNNENTASVQHAGSRNTTEKNLDTNSDHDDEHSLSNLTNSRKTLVNDWHLCKVELDDIGDASI